MLKIFKILFFLSVFPGLFFAKENKQHAAQLTHAIKIASQLNEVPEIYTYFNNNKDISNDEKSIIQQVILAEFYSKKQDRHNKQSIKHYQEALKLSKESTNNSLLAWLYTQCGFYYYNYNNYLEALPYFLKTEKLLQNNNSIEIIDVGNTLKLNGYFWLTIEDYEKSNEYLLKALHHLSTKESNYAAVLNAISNNYRNLHQLDEAILYIEKTKAISNANNDKMRYAKALGDLAVIEEMLGNYQKAEKLLLEDVAISEKENGTRNTMYAKIQLAKIHVKNNNITSAKERLNEALIYVKTKEYLSAYELDIWQIFLKIAILEKNTNRELESRRNIEFLERKIASKDSQDIVKIINWQSQKERIKWQLETEKIKTEKTELIKWTLITVSILSIGLIFSIIKLYKRKVKHIVTQYEKQLLAFKLEQIETEKKLDSTTHSLETFKSYLIEKNKQINNIDLEITKLKDTKKASNMLLKMEELKISHLMTNENWKKFKDVFIKEQGEFYNYITITYPNLTESNLRIILLSFLDISNIETAQLLGVSIDAVKKAKQRLRKKLDTDDQSKIL